MGPEVIWRDGDNPYEILPVFQLEILEAGLTQNLVHFQEIIHEIPGGQFRHGGV